MIANSSPADGHIMADN